MHNTLKFYLLENYYFKYNKQNSYSFILVTLGIPAKRKKTKMIAKTMSNKKLFRVRA